MISGSWERLGPDKTFRMDKLKELITDISNEDKKVIDYFIKFIDPGRVTPREKFLNLS